MKFRYLFGLALPLTAMLLAGCPRTSQENSAGQKAEALKDYDTALDEYNKAPATVPKQYRIQVEGGARAF